MPKSILEFNLPEEEVERDMAHKAGDMYSILCEMEARFRSHVKHGSDPEWHTETIESVREFLLNEMADRCVNFN
jgi:hypothetical protein